MGQQNRAASELTLLAIRVPAHNFYCIVLQGFYKDSPVRQANSSLVACPYSPQNGFYYSLSDIDRETIVINFMNSTEFALKSIDFAKLSFI